MKTALFGKILTHLEQKNIFLAQNIAKLGFFKEINENILINLKVLKYSI